MKVWLWKRVRLEEAEEELSLQRLLSYLRPLKFPSSSTTSLRKLSSTNNKNNNYQYFPLTPPAAVPFSWEQQPGLPNIHASSPATTCTFNTIGADDDEDDDGADIIISRSGRRSFCSSTVDIIGEDGRCYDADIDEEDVGCRRLPPPPARGRALKIWSGSRPMMDSWDRNDVFRKKNMRKKKRFTAKKKKEKKTRTRTMSSWFQHELQLKLIMISSSRSINHDVDPFARALMECSRKGWSSTYNSDDWKKKLKMKEKEKEKEKERGRSGYGGLSCAGRCSCRHAVVSNDAQILVPRRTYVHEHHLQIN